MTASESANVPGPVTGLTERIATFIADFRAADLPDSARTVARECILDSLGTACVGAAMPIADTLFRYLDLEGWHGQGTVVSAERRTSATWAAFANGVLMHSEDFDDSPHTSYFLPAVLAAAEDVDATGEEMLTAWALAFEVWSVLVPSLGLDRPFNITSVLGPIAAAVAAARLYRFSPRQVANAIGIAAAHSGGLQRNFGTDTKPLDAGRTARAGVLAAQLTRVGWTADEQILEGWKGLAAAFGGSRLDLSIAERSLGTFSSTANPPDDATNGGLLDPRAWPPTLRREAPPTDAAPVPRSGPGGRRAILKAWPCCLKNNVPLTALFGLIWQPGFDRGHVVGMDVAVGFDPRKSAVFRSDSVPRTSLEAKFCLPYVMAAACLDGEIAPRSFRSPTFERVCASDLISRVTVRFDPDTARQYGPDFSTVVLHLADGTMRSTTVRSGLELRGPAAVGKFLQNAEPLLGQVDAQRVADTILNLERVPSVRDMMCTFGRSTGARWTQRHRER